MKKSGRMGPIFPKTHFFLAVFALLKYKFFIIIEFILFKKIVPFKKRYYMIFFLSLSSLLSSFFLFTTNTASFLADMFSYIHDSDKRSVFYFLSVMKT